MNKTRRNVLQRKISQINLNKDAAFSVSLDLSKEMEALTLPITKEEFEHWLDVLFLVELFKIPMHIKCKMERPLPFSVPELNAKWPKHYYNAECDSVDFTMFHDEDVVSGYFYNCIVPVKEMLLAEIGIEKRINFLTERLASDLSYYSDRYSQERVLVIWYTHRLLVEEFNNLKEKHYRSLGYV